MRITLLNDGVIFEAESPEELVKSMRDSAPQNAGLDLKEYMETVKSWIKEPALLTDDAGHFLVSLEELGYLKLESD